MDGRDPATSGGGPDHETTKGLLSERLARQRSYPGSSQAILLCEGRTDSRERTDHAMISGGDICNYSELTCWTRSTQHTKVSLSAKTLCLVARAVKAVRGSSEELP